MITNPQKDRLARFLYGKNISDEELGLLSPENFYFGLSRNEIGEAGVINGEIDSNATNYTRIKVANNPINFDVAGGEEGVMQNKKSIQWPTAGDGWGTVKTVFISAHETPPVGIDETALYVASVDLNVAKGATLYYNGGTLKLTVETGDVTE